MGFFFVSEQIALALQKYRKTDSDEEEDDECVFDTITSMMGKEVSRVVHQWPDDTKQGSESVTKHLKPDVIQAPDHKNLTDDIDHHGGTGKVLQFYNDMGQES